MKSKIRAITAGLAVLITATLPSVAFAETELGEAAAAEITLIIPQATIFGVAVIGVLGVITAIMAIISMLKHF